MKVRCSEANKCKDVACQHHCEHEKELRFGMCNWQGCAYELTMKCECGNECTLRNGKIEKQTVLTTASTGQCNDLRIAIEEKEK